LIIRGRAFADGLEEGKARMGGRRDEKVASP